MPQVKQCSEPCNADAHEVCDTSLEEPACACAAGYAGTPCAWAGVLQDPGFADAEAWARTNGATVLEFDTSPPVDRGAAFLAPSVVCNAGGVSQTVEMPPYDAAEPFVAEVTYRAEGVYGIAVGFNRAWRTLPPTEGEEWVTERVCLGEAAYGGPVQFQVASGDQLPSCFTDPVGEIWVDRLDIKLADPDECPALGEVLNGEADEDQGGWEFVATGTVEAGFDPGAGRGGTSGARVFRAASSSGELGMSTKLSVPLPTPGASPALRFWWKGTSGNRFHAEIGTFSVGFIRRAVEDLIGNGSELNYVYCLPPWTHGNVVELGFTVLLNSPPQDAELVVDDVEIVSDASCGDSTDLFDPGFESAPNRVMGATTVSTTQSVALKSDSTLARTGDGVLELAYWNADSLIFLETWLFVPKSNGTEGPAVRFYSNIPAGTQKPIRSVLGRAAVEPADLTVGGGWQVNERCLFPEWSDRWFRVQIRVGDIPPMPAAPLDPPVKIYFDDFELTTSGACRAN